MVEENKAVAKDIENKVSNAVSEKTEIGIYLKIDLKKYIGTSESGNITETAKPVEIRMELPAALKKTGSTIAREYSVVRIHDGAVEILEVNFDGVNISFLTDRFSDYVIVYTDLAYGDVNGDGSVTLHDLLRLGKSIAGIEGTFIYKAAADVNVDGKVTLHDLLRLGKSIAGIEGVVLGKAS